MTNKELTNQELKEIKRIIKSDIWYATSKYNAYTNAAKEKYLKDRAGIKEDMFSMSVKHWTNAAKDERKKIEKLQKKLDELDGKNPEHKNPEPEYPNFLQYVWNILRKYILPLNKK